MKLITASIIGSLILLTGCTLSPIQRGAIYSPQLLSTSVRTWEKVSEAISSNILTSFPASQAIDLSGLELNTPFHTIFQKDLHREFINKGKHLTSTANADLQVTFDFEYVEGNNSFYFNSRGIIAAPIYLMGDFFFGTNSRGLNKNSELAEFIIWAKVYEPSSKTTRIFKEVFFVNRHNKDLFIPSQSVVEVSRFKAELAHLSTFAKTNSQVDFDIKFSQFEQANPQINLRGYKEAIYSNQNWK